MNKDINIHVGELPVTNIRIESISGLHLDDIKTPKNEKLPPFRGVDNETIEFNDNGKIAVKQVPQTKIPGLDEQLHDFHELSNTDILSLWNQYVE